MAGHTRTADEAGHVAGYLGEGHTLTDREGRTLLDGRGDVYGRYRTADDGPEAFGVYWLLPRGRAIVGYCLGGVAMLVRAELTDLSGIDDAGGRLHALRREVLRVCDHWHAVDTEQSLRDPAAEADALTPAGWRSVGTDHDETPHDEADAYRAGNGLYGM